MNEKNRNLAVRIVTALTLLPLVLWMVWRGGWVVGGLFAAAAAASASEYYLIVERRLSPAHVVGMSMAAAWPLFVVYRAGSFASWCLWSMALLFLFAWIYHLIRAPLEAAPTHAAHLLMGLLYGGLGVTALTALRLQRDGLVWVVAALVITWGNDTSAYFAGRFLGRHKLYPEVSPNKTWEGFAGGMVGSIVGMFVLRAFFFPQLAVVDCLFLGVGGGFLGPLGDLSESMLKRAYKVKDSGHLVPGHGGVLDRIDALLFNAPLVFLYATFLRGFFLPVG